MMLDQQLMFADKVPVTVTAAAPNIIDLGPLTGGSGVNLIRDIGAGEPLWIFLSSGAQAVLPTTATVTIALDTSDTEAMGAPIALGNIIATGTVIPAAGLFAARISPANFHRYLRATFTVGGGPITQGALSAGIIWDANAWRAYASGFTTGVFGAQGP
jgi:Bbp16